VFATGDQQNDDWVRSLAVAGKEIQSAHPKEIRQTAPNCQQSQYVEEPLLFNRRREAEK
jgi:hypothetical protein